MHCSTQKPIFTFLTLILRYQRFMSFSKALPIYQLFKFCLMFGIHFDNVSVNLNSVAAALVYLSTASVTIGPRREKTCLRGFANNTGADQPAHPRSLINAFAIRFLKGIIC